MSEPIINVLYLDDDRGLVRLIQKALSRGTRRFEVIPVASGEEALSRIAGGSVDVIALDHYLATGTGLDFLALLAQIPNPPPVVYVTGSAEMNVAVAALKAGAADFVPKTVGDDFIVLLSAALEQAVDKARLKAQNEAAQHEVRAARDRAEVLLAEVNHRVANSLSLVSALVSLQANAMTDEVAKHALDETQARIYAISLLHKRLYSSGDVSVVALDEYLAGLLDHLAVSMPGEGDRTSLTYQLANLKLQTDASINLGVVLTEWVTNAFKYAYPGRPGEVRVKLEKRADGRGKLSVEDDGVGRGEQGTIKGTGVGTRIVNAMAASMDAEIEYADRHPGTAACLIFKLKEPVGEPLH